ncbi:MAG: CPBP family intramembrane metalloprotease [Ruminococcaceae bacterium]|nr:CPBP family intramembrane metalloprotease [Oscillospiraceae bacterium]
MRNKKLALLMPLRSILFILVFVAFSAATGKQLSDISNIWSVAASVINILFVLALVLITKNRGGYLKLINYEKGKTRLKQVFAMTGIILLVGMAGMYLAGFICYGIIPYAAPMMIAPIPAVLAVINLIVLPVSTALAEDSLYLGCGVRQFDNKIVAILVPAFFFALQHSFIPTLFDARYMIYRFISFLPLTVILCIHYRKHQNPLPIMIGHAVIDLATAGQILATSVIPGFYEILINE